MTTVRQQAGSLSMQAMWAMQALQKGQMQKGPMQKLPMQTVLIQLLLTGICALALTLLGWDQATAALLAGACVCLPGVFVAWQFQAPAGEALVGEGRTIGAAMAGLIATVVLMGLVFAFLKPPALGFFSTLAATQVAPLIAATLQDRRRARARRASDGES